jgi:hypothetical protein
MGRHPKPFKKEKVWTIVEPPILGEGENRAAATSCATWSLFGR